MTYHMFWATTAPTPQQRSAACTQMNEVPHMYDHVKEEMMMTNHKIWVDLCHIDQKWIVKNISGQETENSVEGGNSMFQMEANNSYGSNLGSGAAALLAAKLWRIRPWLRSLQATVYETGRAPLLLWIRRFCAHSKGHCSNPEDRCQDTKEGWHLAQDRQNQRKDMDKTSQRVAQDLKRPRRMQEELPHMQRESRAASRC